MKSKTLKLFLFMLSIVIFSSSCSLKTTNNELTNYCQNLGKSPKLENLTKLYELDNIYSLYIYYPQKVNVGDLINIKLISPYNGYLYLFSINPKGNINLLFPNQIVRDNFLGKDILFQTVNNKFLFIAHNPKGTHHILLFISKEQIKFDKIMCKQDLENVIRNLYKHKKIHYIKLLNLEIM